MSTKINKYLLGTTIILLSLGSLISFLIFKYFPFLFHTTIYYCQEFVQSFNLLALPKNTNLLVVGAVFFIFAIIFIRLVMTVFHLLGVGYQLHLHQVDTSTYLDTALIEKLGLKEKIAIIKRETPFALCFGFFKPKIYLSTKLLEITSVKEQETILRHEKHHLDQKDNLTMLFAQVVQNIFPFIPSIQDVVLNFRIERELEADQAAVCNYQKAHMISALKKLLLFEQSSQLAFIPSIASADTLEARIQSLVKNKVYIGRYKWRNIGVSISSMVILLLLAITPVQAIEFHDNGKDAVMACVSNDECARWCKENSSQLHNMTPAANSSKPYSSVNFSHN